MATIRALLLTCAVAMVGACNQHSERESISTLPSLFGVDIGTVYFPSSCKSPADEMVERGVTLLHHMMYDSARLVFAAAEQADPDCGLALWGQAMSFIHPLWPDRPSPEILEWGSALVDRANAKAVDEHRDRDYLSALRAYFEPRPGDTELTRLHRFEREWQRIADDHPDDIEAQAFHALALIAIADRRDKTYVKQHRAAEILEGILARVPDHPGAHHYLIHAYDNPALAPKARPVADRYGAMTPEVPHATHMMTHIYTRLGEWKESVEWNRKSADSAWALCVETGEVTSHYQHALDYLAYAYLQLGADSAALSVVQDAAELTAPFGESNRSAAAYAFAALPARYTLERRDWQAAAALQPRTPPSFPWSDEHLPYVAITYFAKALGNARLGDLNRARENLQELEAVRDAVATFDEYWEEQIEIQVLTVKAWIQLAAGETDEGMAMMLRAAELEQSTEKHAVTPGEVLPATELLGDMLLEAGRPAEAFEAYRQALKRSPKRLNSLYGAARAAEQSGKVEEARSHYSSVSAALREHGERAEISKEAVRFFSST
jgi:tetratricopeptide (TPR) repeat protein